MKSSKRNKRNKVFFHSKLTFTCFHKSLKHIAWSTLQSIRRANYFSFVFVMLVTQHINISMTNMWCASAWAAISTWFNLLSQTEKFTHSSCRMNKPHTIHVVRVIIWIVRTHYRSAGALHNKWSIRVALPVDNCTKQSSPLWVISYVCMRTSPSY